MNVNENYNIFIIKIFKDRPIVFVPLLAEIAGSASAGLFLSQLLFWWGKGANENWIYKTTEEVKRETCLSRSEQDRAIKIWTKLGVLEKRVFGIPPKRNFHIDIEKLIRAINLYLNLQETAN